MNFPVSTEIEVWEDCPTFGARITERIHHHCTPVPGCQSAQATLDVSAIGFCGSHRKYRCPWRHRSRCSMSWDPGQCLAISGRCALGRWQCRQQELAGRGGLHCGRLWPSCARCSSRLLEPHHCHKCQSAEPQKSPVMDALLALPTGFNSSGVLHEYRVKVMVTKSAVLKCHAGRRGMAFVAHMGRYGVMCCSNVPADEALCMAYILLALHN